MTARPARAAATTATRAAARAAAIAAIAAALLLTGCGGDDTPEPGPTMAAGADGHGEWDVSQMPDPCRTVTLPEVSAVLAEPVGAGTRLESWPPLCSFPMPGPPQEFLYVSDDSRPAAAADFARQRTDSATPESVEGIGDKAYWLPDFTALHVLRGPTHLVVKFAGPRPPAEAKAKAMAVARAALPRATAVGP